MCGFPHPTLFERRGDLHSFLHALPGRELSGKLPNSIEASKHDILRISPTHSYLPQHVTKMSYSLMSRYVKQSCCQDVVTGAELWPACLPSYNRSSGEQGWAMLNLDSSWGRSSPHVTRSTPVLPLEQPTFRASCCVVSHGASRLLEIVQWCKMGVGCLELTIYGWFLRCGPIALSGP